MVTAKKKQPKPAPAKANPVGKKKEFRSPDSIGRTNPGALLRAKQEYIFGIIDAAGARHYPTLEEVSARVGLSMGGIAKQAKAGDWVAARKRQAAENEKTMRESIRAAIAAESGKFASDVMETAQVALSHIRRRIANMAVGPNPNPMTFNEVNGVAIALGNLQKVYRLEKGQSTENIAAHASLSGMIDVSGMSDSQLAALGDAIAARLTAGA